jgi:hypothetical protein
MSVKAYIPGSGVVKLEVSCGLFGIGTNTGDPESMDQSVTTASGTAALLAEVTMPVIEPVWARAGAIMKNADMISAITLTAFIIYYVIIYI